MGCHRSGTSLLSGILRSLSASEQLLGSDMPPHLSNPVGHHESTALVTANNRLLAWAGASWDRPFVARPAWEDPNSIAMIGQLRKLVGAHQSVGWIDKDPRLCLTRDAFAHLLLRDLPAVAVVRNPLAVATSLNRRDGFSLRKGAAIWLLYNMHLFNSHSRPPESIIFFDELVSEDEETQLKVARLLAEFLHVACPEFCAGNGTGAIEREVKSRLAEMSRADLIRSENRWRADHDSALVEMLDDIWSGCQAIIRDGANGRIDAFFRNAWATVSPILEPEVALPLRKAPVTGKTSLGSAIAKGLKRFKTPSGNGSGA